MKKSRKTNKPRTRIIPKDLPWGVLVWQTADGRVLSNENGDVLSLECFKGDLEALEKMRLAAAYYGHPTGRAAFLPGRRKISQSEYEDQMEAFIEGRSIPGDIEI